MRVVFMILLIPCVNSDTRSVQQSVYVSRKSRSNSEPLESGYVYSKVDTQPGTLAMFGNDASHYNSFSSGRYSDIPLNTISDYDSNLHNNNLLSSKTHSHSVTPVSKYDYEYEKSKAEASFDAHYLPSKMKSDAMYERLKSLMYYKYPDSGGMGDMAYDTHMSDYHVDDDDVRTSSRISYDGWPYYYHSPYEYETMKIESDMEKAKDKRYITGKNKDFIPVHENVDDIPNVNSPTVVTTRYDRQVSTDNPIYGNQPFFSFVLNDYYDKNTEDDHLNFKGLDWGKGFDHATTLTEPDNGIKRDRRLQNSYTPVDESYFHDKSSANSITSKASIGESSTEKGYHKKYEFDNHEKGNSHNENHKSAFDQNGNNYRGYKDFVDTFANKFGGVENKKDSKYVLKKEQDKGEKRKGFRRVYHKDEYQEDNEFFDNTKNSAKSEENGIAAIHNGGSEAIVQSHAAAATGNDANSYSNSGNKADKKFENNHKGHNYDRGYNNGFNRYGDVAKLAARSNNADYLDHYRPY